MRIQESTKKTVDSYDKYWNILRDNAFEYIES